MKTVTPAFHEKQAFRRVNEPVHKEMFAATPASAACS